VVDLHAVQVEAEPVFKTRWDSKPLGSFPSTDIPEQLLEQDGDGRYRPSE
jgi:hypothetical protein